MDSTGEQNEGMIIRGDVSRLWVLSGSGAHDNNRALLHEFADNRWSVYTIPSTNANQWAISDFDISGEQLVLLSGDYLVVFDRTPVGYVQKGFTKLNFAYTDLRLSGDTCILLGSMFRGKNYQRYTWAARYRLDSLVLLEEMPFPEPDGVVLTLFQPRRLIDGTAMTTAVAGADRYSILLYDLDGRLTHSLRREPANWVNNDSTDLSLEKYRDVNVKNTIERLSARSETFSSIRDIQFVNEGTLLVKWNTLEPFGDGLLKGRHKYRYDVWRTDGKRWSLSDSDMVDYNPGLTDIVGGNKLWPMSDKFRCDRGVILSTEPIPVEAEAKPLQKLIDDVEAYYNEHDIRYSVVRHLWRQ